MPYSHHEFENVSTIVTGCGSECKGHLDAAQPIGRPLRGQPVSGSNDSRLYPDRTPESHLITMSKIRHADVGVGMLQTSLVGESVDHRLMNLTKPHSPCDIATQNLPIHPPKHVLWGHSRSDLFTPSVSNLKLVGNVSYARTLHGLLHESFPILHRVDSHLG